jgi:hypothetical protein
VAAAIQAIGISVPFDQNLINFVYVNLFCGMNTEPFAIFKGVNYMVNARFDLYTRWRFVFRLIIIGQNHNFAFSQNAQVTVVVRVLSCFKPFGYNHSFSVQSIAKMMFNARVSLKHPPALFSYLGKIAHPILQSAPAQYTGTTLPPPPATMLANVVAVASVAIAFHPTCLPVNAFNSATVYDFNLRGAKAFTAFDSTSKTPTPFIKKVNSLVERAYEI